MTELEWAAAAWRGVIKMLHRKRVKEVVTPRKGASPSCGSRAVFILLANGKAIKFPWMFLRNKTRTVTYPTPNFSPWVVGLHDTKGTERHGDGRGGVIGERLGSWNGRDWSSGSGDAAGMMGKKSSDVCPCPLGTPSSSSLFGHSWQCWGESSGYRTLQEREISQDSSYRKMYNSVTE